MKTKPVYVSGLGWLCYYSEPTQSWIPLFRLTPEQLKDWNECVMEDRI